MKKTLVILLAVVMGIVLMACGNSEPSAASAPPASSSDASSQPAEETPVYPESTVTIVVGASAGSASDASGRTIARYLEKYTGGTYIVQNIPSSGGMAGRQVKDTKADGYTALLCETNIPVLFALGTYNDFGLDVFEIGPNFFTCSTDVLVVSKDSPYKTLGDLVEAAKQNPGEIIIGTSTGNTTHLLCLGFAAASGTEFKLVDAGGSSDRSIALMNGSIDVCFQPYSVAKPYLESGDLVALALPYAQTNEDLLPGVPTIQSLGYDYVFPGFFTSLAFPADTPDYVLEVIDAAAQQMIEDPEFIDEVISMGCLIDYRSPADNLTNIEYEKEFYSDIAAMIQ